MYDTVAKSISSPEVKDCIKAVYYLNAQEAVDNALAEFGMEASYGDDLKVLTICIAVLRNGFTIIGKSACVDPAIYDAEIGRKIAYADACRQAESYTGFLRKQDMYEEAIFEDAVMFMNSTLSEEFV